MELKELKDKMELVLIIFLVQQEVVVDFVEIVVTQVQVMFDMQDVMMQVDVIVIVGGDGVVVAKEF